MAQQKKQAAKPAPKKRGRPAGSKNAPKGATPATPAATKGPKAPTWPPGSGKAAGVAAEPVVPKMTADQAMSELWRWHQLKEHIAATVKPLVEQEMELRKAMFEFFFGPKPKEGTTRIELKEGWAVKAVYELDRQFDEAAMPAVFAKLPEGSADYLVRQKPVLITKVYKEMPEDLREVLDECVITKPKAPTLELIPPKAEA